MNVEELKKSVKNKNISPEDFLVELWKLSNGIIRTARKYSVNTVSIYRTRVFRENIRPRSVSALSYPPLEKSRLGRANIKGEQVFYASAGMPTTLAESRAQSGEYIIVSKWKNVQDLILQEVGFSANLIGVESIYHDIFTSEDESIYEYSSRVAQHLMDSDFISGLLYPSIINSNKSHNVVLKKKDVDDKMTFLNATCYYIKNISGSMFETEQIDFGVLNDQNILEWKGRKKQWNVPPGIGLRMVSNGWDGDAFRADGTLVEPN